MSTAPSRSGSRRPATPKLREGGKEEPPAMPPIPTLNSRNSTSAAHAPKRSSLGFLRRSKSGDPVRKPVVAPAPPKLPVLWSNGSGGFPTQLLSKDVQESDDDEPAHGRSHGPGIALHARAGNLNGGYVPGRKSTDSAIETGGHYVSESAVPISQDPYANIGSMAHRGRYSYASSAVSTVNSPRRVRRRKDPTPFNIMIVGAKNSGKTSFLEFLRQSLALKSKNDEAPAPVTAAAKENGFKSTYLETEIDNERIGLTLWDSAGLERNMIDLQIRETVAFIENKFEETFSEETKVVRAPGVRDTHIHCVFLLLDPARLTPNNHFPGKIATSNEVGGLDAELDIAMLEALQGKTVVIPVVSKADTCTTKHMDHLKGLVRQGLAKAKLDPLETLELEMDSENGSGEEVSASSTENAPSINEEAPIEVDDQESVPGDGSPSEGEDLGDQASIQHSDKPKGSANTDTAPIVLTAGLSFVPLSIISPDSYDPALPVGRHFSWGFADPHNESHCDFGRLKDCVFSEWRGELREKSRINWYENWRSERLGGSERGREGRRF